MDTQFAESVTVWIVGDGADANETRAALAGKDDRLSTTLAAPDAALDRTVDGDLDCLVVHHSPGVNAPTVVERAAERAPNLPVVVFAAPEEGVTERALAAGATGVVSAGGQERYARLAHRVRTAADIERKQTAHETTRARFEALTENTAFAVVSIDEDSTVQFASDAIEGLLGYEPSELVGESLTAVMPERFQGAHHAGIDRYLTTGERELEWDWIELPAEHRDGHEVPLGISFGERTGRDGRLFTAILRDITDRKEREERLNRLASAVESSMDGLAVLDEGGDYRYVNDAHAKVYGYERPAKMVGLNWRSCYDDDERERFETEVMPALSKAGSWRGEAVGRRADGSTFPQELTLSELDDGGLVCVVRDITERAARRRELREEREFTEAVLNALQDVFYVLDDDGTFQRWNDQMCEVTGYTDAELDGMHALEVIPADDQELIAGAIANVFRGGDAVTIRSALRTKQGEHVPQEFNGTPVLNTDGAIVGLAGTGRDITQQQLRKQRLDVLSRVLRHNVRNRMNVVQGNAEYIQNVTEDAVVNERAEEILGVSEQLVDLSDHARKAESLLREGQPGRTAVDLVTIVERGLASVDTDPTDNLRTDLPDSAPAVAADGLSVAVTEVIQNALDHTEDPCVDITVTSESGPNGERTIIRVADGGDGIPTHERQVLTAGKETDLNHGIGIGLWLVNWLVTVSGGEVRFHRSDRGGSEVVMSFPTS